MKVAQFKSSDFLPSSCRTTSSSGRSEKIVAGMSIPLPVGVASCCLAFGNGTSDGSRLGHDSANTPAFASAKASSPAARREASSAMSA